MIRALSFAIFFALAAPACAGGPVFSPSGPDAAAYGAAEGYPVGKRAWPLPQASMVGSFSHFDRKYPVHTVARADVPSPLRYADTELELTYEYNGATYSLADYLARNPATGLLIAQGDTILYEHYQYARTDRDTFLSQSMAKTLVGLMVGIALHEGAIRSLDQPAADYVPDLAGTEYGKTPIRALLHMASGVAYNEDYELATADNRILNRMLFTPGGPPAARAVARFNTREVPPDTRFRYAGIETEVLGLVVSAAVKMPLAAYLQSRIWQPMGAEADAAWTLDANGQEVAPCCVSAVLRDWARVGLMLAHDGEWNGQRIVPADYLLAATTVEFPFQKPGVATRLTGYGDQIWLLPAPRREFALLGIHGQVVAVDPAAHLVAATTAVRLKPSKDPSAAEFWALWRALAVRLGG